MIDFNLKKTSNKARLGSFLLNEQNIDTPCFMPVGTAEL